MNNLACASCRRENRDKAKARLQEYFIEHGYGQQFYSPEEIKEIFRQLDAVGLLFPDNGGDLVDLYDEWREEHEKYWFNKWYFKSSRRL